MGSRLFSISPEEIPHLEAFLKERETDFFPCNSLTRSSSSFLPGTAFQRDSALQGYLKTAKCHTQNLEKQEAGAGQSLQGLVSAPTEGIYGK